LFFLYSPGGSTVLGGLELCEYILVFVDF